MNSMNDQETTRKEVMGMRGVNNVILIGNPTRNAELRTTTSGKAVAGIRLATNRSVRTADGARREERQFHSIVCWDSLAETTSRYVKKGDPLYIEGRLAYRQYTDSDGQTRGAVEIVAADVQFLSGRRDGRTGQSTAADEVAAPTDDVTTVDEPIEDLNLDELPF